ncbi:DUF4189 domain-containing protein [Stenotrophomonas maltophilia]|uniref:DUF4189 domain-containing protein n=1 Tax=Stenotrophomonas maltophilia TaxID=40324 RepID=A0A270NQE7_STEMA|nr:DUF4189 domain-containing protein [Stenotrophomonas maltophilia]MBA0388196.1 DUF4189 domain-containing protein [Stenotrophomonas maltophilia]MBA0393433.1 DUF4189 domain-containing protein [Stenotrophomonas maltophilia]MBA0466607.1 DUF4189 domain-containing protein [Stenotrophomonas maltophilia]MBA0472901.1 DUF4189 domain-containing protein [Stenotrophomonas maltophilia]PAM74267.1 hypothetical protein CEK00_02850 [Stenotrophomonas maltophilia]
MIKFFLAAALLIAPFSALAEGRCPPGQYPVGGQGVGGCAPIPGGSSSPSTGSSAPVPAGKWETRWGAIAEDKKPATGGLMATGVSVSQKSKRAAEAAAIDGCVRRGGTKCEIRLSYHDQCAAIADPSPRSGGRAAGNSIVASAETLDEAQSLALKECASVNDGGACEVAYSACSMSEFRAYR